VNKLKGLIVVVGLSAFALAAVACSNNGEADTTDTVVPQTQASPAGTNAAPAPVPAVAPSAPAPATITEAPVYPKRRAGPARGSRGFGRGSAIV